MSALTEYSLHKAINHLLDGGVFVALHTADPGANGSASEVDASLDTDYARQATSFAPASGGRTQNTTPLSWTVNSASPGYTVTHLSLWDAATGGNSLFVGELAVPITLAAGDVNNALAASTIIIKGM